MPVSPSHATDRAAPRPFGGKETLQLHRLREQIQLPRMQWSSMQGEPAMELNNSLNMRFDIRWTKTWFIQRDYIYIYILQYIILYI